MRRTFLKEEGGKRMVRLFLLYRNTSSAFFALCSLLCAFCFLLFVWSFQEEEKAVILSRGSNAGITEIPIRVSAAVGASFRVGVADERGSAGCIAVLHVQVLHSLRSIIAVQKDVPPAFRLRAAEADGICACALQDECTGDR